MDAGAAVVEAAAEEEGAVVVAAVGCGGAVLERGPGSAVAEAGAEAGAGTQADAAVAEMAAGLAKACSDGVATAAVVTRAGEAAVGCCSVAPGPTGMNCTGAIQGVGSVRCMGSSCCG